MHLDRTARIRFEYPIGSVRAHRKMDCCPQARCLGMLDSMVVSSNNSRPMSRGLRFSSVIATIAVLLQAILFATHVHGVAIPQAVACVVDGTLDRASAGANDCGGGRGDLDEPCSICLTLQHASGRPAESLFVPVEFGITPIDTSYDARGAITVPAVVFKLSARAPPPLV